MRSCGIGSAARICSLWNNNLGRVLFRLGRAMTASTWCRESVFVTINTIRTTMARANSLCQYCFLILFINYIKKWLSKHLENRCSIPTCMCRRKWEDELHISVPVGYWYRRFFCVCISPKCWDQGNQQRRRMSSTSVISKAMIKKNFCFPYGLVFTIPVLLGNHTKGGGTGGFFSAL